MADTKKTKNSLSPALRFPEFNGEWKQVKFKDILRIGNGRDYKHLDCGDIPVFGSGGVITQVNKALHVGESVFIGRKGTINKPFYYNGAFWTVDTLFYTHSFSGVYPKFVLYLFQNIDWNKYNEASGVPSLSKNNIENIECHIPPTEEQYRILGLLTLLDERIATQREIIEGLEKLKSAIARRLFKCNVPIVPLGKLASVTNGDADVQDATDNYEKGLYPFFDRSEQIKYLSQYHLDKVAIIYAGEGQNFYPRFYKGKFALHQRCYAIYDFDKCVVPRYCYHYMQRLNKYFQKTAVGSTVASLRRDNFINAPIKIPNTSTQEHIANVLDSIENAISVEQNLLSSFILQRKYLFSKLFI